MNTQAIGTWHEANQQYLSAALAMARAALQRHAAQVSGHGEADTEASQQAAALQQVLQATASHLPGPSALDTLCSALALSAFAMSYSCALG
jgi:hypothetical protein